MTRLRGSILIPAHNEAAVIGRCLDSLLNGFMPGEVEVAVVCNGCIDETANIARSRDYSSIRVLETKVASKTNALRIGDADLTAFPRIYVDADVVLPSESARHILARLEQGPALAARPPLHFETTRSTRPVRAYYRARARVPKLVESLWGAGVYALSAEGRARFGEYPDVIGDDLFVDQCFERSEVEIVDSAPVTVVAPRLSKDLLAVLRRTYRGNKENRESAGGGQGTTSSTVRELLKTTKLGPMQAIDNVIYMGLVTSARLMTVFSTGPRWERDHSSRVEVPQ